MFVLLGHSAMEKKKLSVMQFHSTFPGYFSRMFQLGEALQSPHWWIGIFSGLG